MRSGVMCLQVQAGGSLFPRSGHRPRGSLGGTAPLVCTSPLCLGEEGRDGNSQVKSEIPGSEKDTELEL